MAPLFKINYKINKNNLNNKGENENGKRKRITKERTTSKGYIS